MKKRTNKVCNASFDVKFGDTASVVNTMGSKELIQIGSGAIINGHLQSYYGKGIIKIGKKCYVGPNTYIWSFMQVEIGDHVLISHNCNIIDSNCHPINAEERSLFVP